MKYKCVKQYDTTDCAAACIATIALQYGKTIPMEVLREQTNTDRNGASIKDIVEASKIYDMAATPVECDISFDVMELNLPCIAHVKLSEGIWHFVIIHKIEKSTVIIADPAYGLRKVNRKIFFERRNCDGLEWDGIMILFEINRERWKKNKENSLITELLKLLSTEKKRIGLIITFSVIAASLNLLGVLYYKVLIDTLIPNEWIYTVVTVSLIFIVIGLLKCIFNIFQVKNALILSKSLNEKLTMSFYKHVVSLPLVFHVSRKRGDIVSRFQDIAEIQDIVVSALLTIPVNLGFILIVCSILAFENMGILLIVIGVFVLYFISTILFKGKYNSYNYQQMKQASVMTSFLIESLEGIDTIKAYSLEKTVINNLKDKYALLQKLVFKLGNLGNLQYSLKASIGILGEILILCVGGMGVISGNMTVGELISINILIGYLLGPFQHIIDLQPKLHTAIIALRRIESIMSMPLGHEGNIELTQVNNISFENVSFHYGSNHNILENICFYFEKGNKYAIVGESGSGKTTLAKLLSGLYSYDSGCIKINDVAIEDITSTSLHRKIIYVSQEDYLFAGTIKENLLLDKESCDVSSIEEALRISCANEFVMKLFQGYETYLDENGSNISKGQRQRILLARALLRKPEVLILDEATSNIDEFTEKEIFERINTLRREMILIVISHRRNILQDSDQIYDVDT